MKLRRYLFAGLLVTTVPAFAQYTNRSSVLDSSGTVSSSGALTNISATGQPGGISTSEGGALVNQAGFLNTFSLKPGLDTDGDGIADELDKDNDNDGLVDATEVTGSGFAPQTATQVNIADTDGDGVLDGWESTAGTDPTNPNAFLEIVAISNTPIGKGVAWLARGNNERTYVVYARSTVAGAPGTVVFSNTVSGGSAPWYAVTNSLADATISNMEFYAVEVRP